MYLQVHQLRGTSRRRLEGLQGRRTLRAQQQGVLPQERRLLVMYWACVNKDCPRKGIPVWAETKPDCVICRKPLKELP